MSKLGVDRLRKAWRWVIVLVLFLGGVSYLVSEHLGTTLTASGVIELEKDLVQVNGLLIAFTGIIFTGMLAEVRFRTERALHAADNLRVERLDRTSKVLRKCAFASFLFFTASLGDAVGNLAGVLASMSSQSMASVFVLPMMLMIGGLALLLVALALIALE